VAVAERPWVIRQAWHDLLFAHWPIGATMRAAVPRALELDTFEDAWLGIVRSDERGRPRWMPSLPRLSAFEQRADVRDAGEAGVHFFSLQARNPLVTIAARGSPAVLSRAHGLRAGW
jgi:uncharacterized protein YqjF (DUF2071 family)